MLNTAATTTAATAFLSPAVADGAKRTDVFRTRREKCTLCNLREDGVVYVFTRFETAQK